jgi:hypothetical protein
MGVNLIYEVPGLHLNLEALRTATFATKFVLVPKLLNGYMADYCSLSLIFFSFMLFYSTEMLNESISNNPSSPWNCGSGAPAMTQGEMQHPSDPEVWLRCFGLPPQKNFPNVVNNFLLGLITSGRSTAHPE